MPIYEYRCERGHKFEVMQGMADAPLSGCATCDAPVQRVFNPVAVHFKGSGFYTTDYGRGRKNGSAGGSGEGSSEGKESKETAGSKDGSKGESKGSKPKAESAKPGSAD